MTSTGQLSVRRVRFGLVLLVGCGAGLLMWAIFSGPVGQWWQLRTHLAETREKLVAMEYALDQREQVEAQCRQFEQRILARGTDAQESALLLDELESLTREANVEVKSMRSMSSQKIGDYRKFAVSLELEARVQGMLEFLHAVDSSSKILTVESLTVRALRSGPNLLGAAMVVSRMTSSESTLPLANGTTPELTEDGLLLSK